MISKITEKNEKLFIEIDGQLFTPLSFKSFRPTRRNISDFYNAGIRLFNILSTGKMNALGTPYSLFGESWINDYEYDFSVIDKQVELFIENAPEAFFSVMIQIDTRDWWLKKYPEYEDTFRCLSQIGTDEKWRNCAAEYLKNAIIHLEKKYGEKIFGYFILCGTTTEWLSDFDFEKYHPIKEKAFKEWKKDKNAVIPDEKSLYKKNDQVFLDLKKDYNIIEYRKFHNEIISDTILYFAEQAQKVLNHNKLIGIYYGYLFELWGERLWDGGHLNYERVFSCKDIDMFACPFSYAFRGVDDPSGIMVTDKTLSKNRKLLFLEHDQTTYLLSDGKVSGRLSGDEICLPEHPVRYENKEDNIDVMRRDILLALSKDCAVWWFDMFEGWFYSDELMGEIRNLIGIYDKIYKEATADNAEIAVIADPNSVYYMNKTNILLSYFLCLQRRDISFIGAPYDVFSSCDINFDTLKKYKLIIFMNQYFVNEKIIMNINKLRSDNRVLFWNYASGCINEDKFDVKNISRLTGIKIKKNNKCENYIKTEYGNYGLPDKINLSFSIIDKDAVIKGKYLSSGEDAVGYKRFADYSSYYSALGDITSGILRDAAKLANVHLYCDNDDNLVYVKDKFIGIYRVRGSETVINLKEDGQYLELFSGKHYTSKNKVLKISNDECRVKLFLKVD